MSSWSTHWRATPGMLNIHTWIKRLQWITDPQTLTLVTQAFETEFCVEINSLLWSCKKMCCVLFHLLCRSKNFSTSEAWFADSNETGVEEESSSTSKKFLLCLLTLNWKEIIYNHSLYIVLRTNRQETTRTKVEWLASQWLAHYNLQ